LEALPLSYWYIDACRKRLARDESGNSMDEDLKAEIERLRNENAALKKSGSAESRIRVSPKGGVSVYGMGKYPVTLYKEQWLKLLSMSDEIRENEAKLKTKE
jgi:hypothetical protein